MLGQTTTQGNILKNLRPLPKQPEHTQTITPKVPKPKIVCPAEHLHFHVPTCVLSQSVIFVGFSNKKHGAGAQNKSVHTGVLSRSGVSILPGRSRVRCRVAVTSCSWSYCERQLLR